MGKAKLAHGPWAGLALAGTFAALAVRYWLTIYPRVCLHLRAARRRARAIPDPQLRAVALQALAKRGNIEGAAAFTVLAPWRTQGTVLRALLSFQSAYNYTDALAEQRNGDPTANARCLHEALLVALEPGIAQRVYYRLQPAHDDGGYLTAIVDECRLSLARLPSYAMVRDRAREAAERVVAFQSLTLGGERCERQRLQRWARAQTPAGTGLAWSETAAACGSSLPVLALIAAAADSVAEQTSLTALGDAYFPWIGALHSLLDSLLDTAEDARTGQLSLIGCYLSREQAAQRVALLTCRGLHEAARLRAGRRHTVLLAGMAGLYVSDPALRSVTELSVAHAVRAELGALAAPTLLVFAARHRAARVLRFVRRAAGRGSDRTAASSEPGCEELDARAA
jgi:tetraprenyl-beta-curcumene synthase